MNGQDWRRQQSQIFDFEARWYSATYSKETKKFLLVQVFAEYPPKEKEKLANHFGPLDEHDSSQS